MFFHPCHQMGMWQKGLCSPVYTAQEREGSFPKVQAKAVLPTEERTPGKQQLRACPTQTGLWTIRNNSNLPNERRLWVHQIQITRRVREQLHFRNSNIVGTTSFPVVDCVPASSSQAGLHDGPQPLMRLLSANQESVLSALSDLDAAIVTAIVTVS